LELVQSQLALLKHEIEDSLNEHTKNLVSLRDIPPIPAILRARMHNGIDPESDDTLQEWRKRLEAIFGALLANHPHYFQLRFIAADGNELVRVNQGTDGITKAVAADKLQNKSDAFYVSETLKLNTGEIHYSDVTLNREHGVIQVPHTSVLRLATPVYSTDK
jgi:hypothetical protein